MEVGGVGGAEQGAEDVALDQLAGELGEEVGMGRGGRHETGEESTPATRTTSAPPMSFCEPLWIWPLCICMPCTCPTSALSLVELN